MEIHNTYTNNDHIPAQDTYIKPEPNLNLVEQLNAYCQATVKTKWTAKKIRIARESCGFSYVENKAGDWVMMPSLCPNCDHILQAVNKAPILAENKDPKWFFTHHTQKPSTAILPSPIYSGGSDNSSMDYLIYSTGSQSSKKMGCCTIM